MEKIKVIVAWEEHNYSAVCDSVNGLVIDTNKDLEKLKKSFKEGFDFHIKSSLEDGDELPDFIKQDNYELGFQLEVSALLQSLSGVLTRSALARVTGINEKQLGHYMSGHRKPRADKRRKIIDGIHQIGARLTAVV